MKKLLALLLVLMLTFSLAACAKDDPATETQSQETTAAPTTEVAKTYTAEEVVKIYEVRKALTLAIDRTLLVEQITRAGQLPATGFVPPGLKDSTGADFRATAGDYGISPDGSAIDEAKQLLADAGFPNGENFPTLTILYNTSEGHKAIAEAIQEMWKQNLNINVEIANQEWAVFQDTRHQGNFQVARAGWIGDYEDPMTFLDLWTSYSGNNDAQWKVKKYDDVIEASKLATGADRDALLYEAEQMIMNDLIVLPIYYYTHTVAVKEEVKDWYTSTLGHFYFGNVSTTDGTLQWNVGSEPKTIDPALNSAVDGGNVINNTFEGLMRKDDVGIQPAMAESYTISDDLTVYTFKLRDAKWSDGQPVKAQDFEYAWKRALDPAVASEYGFQMFYIKGAQEYYNGTGSIDDVMIKAVDDKTFEVTLNAPTPYFLDLTTFYTFMPVRQDMVEKDPEGWAINPATAVSNGPFKLSEYKTGDRIVLVPNTNYWQAEKTKLTRIDAMMIVDQSTALTAYEAGELDIMDSFPVSEIPRLIAEDPTFKIMPYVGTYYYIFNVGIDQMN
ncbi:ABC transporter substrate-binding protein [Fusibacter bizertensis]